MLLGIAAPECHDHQMTGMSIYMIHIYASSEDASGAEVHGSTG